MPEIIEQVRVWAGILGPNVYLQASVTVLGFVVFGKLAQLILSRVFGRIVSRSSSNFDDQLVQLLQRPVFITFTLIGLGAATRILDLPKAPADVAINVMRTIAIAIWYGFFHNAFALVLQAISRTSQRNSVYVKMLPLIDTVGRVTLLALAVYFVFLAWNIELTAWLASAGIIGLALSFAAKDTLSNLFAGVSIVADAPYKKGDFIILESGERGVVTQIGLRSTRILTRDDIEITVPNGIIGNSKIINEAGGPSAKHRIRVAVGVAYGSDIDNVIAVLDSIAAEHDEVCAEPAPRVRFRRFGDSSLDVELLCWIERPVDRGRMLHELNCTIYKRFNQEQIEIPFPQRDLHVRTMPGA